MEYVIMAVIGVITLILGFVIGFVTAKPAKYTNAGSLIIDKNKTYGVEMYLEAAMEPDEISKNRSILLNVINTKSH